MQLVGKAAAASCGAACVPVVPCRTSGSTGVCHLPGFALAMGQQRSERPVVRLLQCCPETLRTFECTHPAHSEIDGAAVNGRTAKVNKNELYFAVWCNAVDASVAPCRTARTPTGSRL